MDPIDHKHKQTKPAQRYFLTVVATISFVLLLCAVLIVGVIQITEDNRSREAAQQKTATIQEQQPKDETKQQEQTEELRRDPALVKVLDAVGAIDTEGIQLEVVDALKNPARVAEYAYQVDARGYWESGVLRVKSSLKGDELNRYVAHEYMHHVWAKLLTKKQRRQITNDTIQLYGQDGAMQQRAAPYAREGSLDANELFAMYCTEAVDSRLTDRLRLICQQHINRAALVLS